MSDFIVGIDLGTTHTVVAYAAQASVGRRKKTAPAGPIQLFDIEQLVAPGEVAAQPLLPSVRYHPAPGELAEADLQLPWLPAESADATPAVMGRWARHLGAQVPGRLVASAKSWLSHTGVDRLAPILPWGAAADVPKISPVAASASYLRHVHAAWNARFPKSPLAQQDLVLTVPASFDEAARALTLQAAREAGLPNLRLLEEPQAAFYDWLLRHRADLGQALGTTKLVLVADVGGGTTDFSLIQVELQEGEPRLTRIGVGKHLMLGGDNMDLALAHWVESRMNTGGADGNARLSAAQLAQLMERCRVAKEQLLAFDAPPEVRVTLLGSGSRLIRCQPLRHAHPRRSPAMGGGRFLSPGGAHRPGQPSARRHRCLWPALRPGRRHHPPFGRLFAPTRAGRAPSAGPARVRRPRHPRPAGRIAAQWRRVSR